MVSFFWFFAQWWINGISIFAKIWTKTLFVFFGLFLKNLVISFSWNWSKLKTNIAIDISPPITYLAKFWILSYGPKCCWPIKFQDSLKWNISRKKWMMKFIFGMQINVELFYKLILSFWVCIAHGCSLRSVYGTFSSRMRSSRAYFLLRQLTNYEVRINFHSSKNLWFCYQNMRKHNMTLFIECLTTEIVKT